MKNLRKIRFFVYTRFLRRVEKRMASYGLPITASDRKLLKLKNIHGGKRCFIIGNGPSLRMDDLSTLHDHNEITFAANKIYLAFQKTKWRPTYYCSVDRIVIEQIYDDLQHRLDSEIIKFYPDFLDLYMKRFRKSIYFRYSYVDRYPEWPLFSYNPIERIWGGNTGMYIHMQLAYFMGIKTIYLLGVDFDYSLEGAKLDNTSKIVIPVYISEGVNNYFHPDYFRQGEKFCYPNLERHETAFLSAKNALDKKGVNIFNATRGGKLEIYERVDFDRIF